MSNKNIRMIVADDAVRFPDGIVPVDYESDYSDGNADTPPPPPISMPRPGGPRGPGGGANSIHTIALILALLAAASYIIAGAALMSSAHDAADRYIEQSKRKMRRMMQNIKNMPQWGEAKGMYKKILSSIVSKGLTDPDDMSVNASYKMSNVDGGHIQAIIAYTNIVEADLPFMGSNRPMRQPMDSMGPSRRTVQKTKVKVAIRVLTVATGLIAVALQLFKTMSDWEDDDGMVELYHDTKGLLNSLRSGGGSGSILERAMRTEVYRTLRNTPGIGSLMPRGGRPII